MQRQNIIANHEIVVIVLCKQFSASTDIRFTQIALICKLCIHPKLHDKG